MLLVAGAVCEGVQFCFAARVVSGESTLVTGTEPCFACNGLTACPVIIMGLWLSASLWVQVGRVFDYLF